MKIAAATVVGILVVLLFWFVTEQADNCITGYEETNCETIYEDDPRWNCATMGNLICGPERE